MNILGAPPPVVQGTESPLECGPNSRGWLLFVLRPEEAVAAAGSSWRGDLLFLRADSPPAACRGPEVRRLRVSAAAEWRVRVGLSPYVPSRVWRRLAGPCARRASERASPEETVGTMGKKQKNKSEDRYPEPWTWPGWEGSGNNRSLPAQW